MEWCGGGAGKKILEVSVEAQRLALAAKHLGIPPFELWHVGWPEDEDRVPGRPQRYRALLYAMGEWLEDREVDMHVETSAMAVLRALAGKGPKKKKRGRRKL